MENKENLLVMVDVDFANATKFYVMDMNAGEILHGTEFTQGFSKQSRLIRREIERLSPCKVIIKDYANALKLNRAFPYTTEAANP